MGNIKKGQKKCVVICPNPSIDIQAHIDGFIPGQPTRIQQAFHYPGGKGLHVGMALAELGIPCEVIGIWGKDNGQTLISSCQDFYPELLVSGPFVEGANRSCYSFISGNEWNGTELLGPGPQITPQITELIFERISNQKEDIHSVAVCGSWPKGASMQATAQVVSYCKNLGIPCFIDASGGQLTEAIKEEPYFIHVNRSELEELYPGDFYSAIGKLTGHCTVAAITDGSNGLFYGGVDNQWHANVRLDPQDIVSTVGAGDCLTAGLLKAHFEGLEVEISAKWGAACGAANCLRPDLGMLEQKVVERLMADVETQYFTIPIL